jgi:S-adenosylmethionine-diacylgycerolhomoserine-N-methlytransferase
MMTAQSESQTKAAMDNMYRLTRHVYDASRKYYLLGRDRLISELQPKDGETICEVGCGTARNLIKMAHAYPDASFYGLDASEEMLKTANAALKKKNLTGNIKIAHAFAQSFDPQKLFQLSKPLDKIVFSYALSIIPPWRESIDHALTLLPSGGQMHIVDFGSMEGQSPWFRKIIFKWLALFHVYHKPEILDYLKRLEFEKSGTLSVQHLYRGYAYIARFTKA